MKIKLYLSKMKTKNCASVDFHTNSKIVILFQHFTQITNNILFTDSSPHHHASRETIMRHHSMKKKKTVREISLLCDNLFSPVACLCFDELPSAK